MHLCHSLFYTESHSRVLLSQYQYVRVRNTVPPVSHQTYIAMQYVPASANGFL